MNCRLPPTRPTGPVLFQIQQTPSLKGTLIVSFISGTSGREDIATTCYLASAISNITVRGLLGGSKGASSTPLTAGRCATYGPRYKASVEPVVAPTPRPTEASIRNNRSQTSGTNPLANPVVPGSTRLRAVPVSRTKQTSPLPAASSAMASPRPGLTANPRQHGSPQEKLSVTGPQAGPTTGRRSHRGAKWIGIVVSAILLIGAAIPMTLKMRSAPAPSSTQPIRYLGVYQRDISSSYSGVTAFTTATGVRPDVLTYFSSWLEPFQTNFATSAAEHGALPLVQINPYNVSLAAIAAGQYDSYLSAFAEAVRTYSHPVILSFGHEMNGNWYPWAASVNGNTPASYVASWRHVHDIFRAAGASNVLWVWAPNAGGPTPISQVYPGDAYVDIIGMDGYNRGNGITGDQTPSQVFSSLLSSVRSLAPSKPVLITETGTTERAGNMATWLEQLFAFVHSQVGLIGVVYSDFGNWVLDSPQAVTGAADGLRGL